jgi:hypothetical protein
MVMGVMAPAAVGAPAIRETVDAPFDEVFGDGGSASIVRTGSGISVRVHADGLRPGNAYTAWFAVFDDVTCNLDGDNGFPGGILSNMAGHVVTGGGTATFAGQLSAGPIGEPNGLDILLNDDGSFDNPLGACVDIHIVNHGPAGDFLPGELQDAINTIFGAMPPADQVYRFLGDV